jgi:hypothetical protein
VVGEIRIYVEGGGDQRSGKAAIREGFSKFLGSVREKARAHRVRWNIIACGSIGNAVEDYRNALIRHPDAFNVLLVDSDGPVDGPPAEHLRMNAGFDMSDLSPDQIHLMVQVMEAWVISDAEALNRFYGVGLNANALPRHMNIEEVAKEAVYQGLKTATRNTTKGEYHKIRHGPKILAMLTVQKVRERAPHCDRLFTLLEESLGEN